MLDIDRKLSLEKRTRDDESKYIDTNLIRQRRVNEAVIGFASSYLKPGDVLLDACAGPEGSYLASVRRGLQWFGNDISTRFAQVLQSTGANIVMSDFAHAPFRESSANAVAFIYALENINHPGSAIAETARVLKPGGIAVYCEPGLSWFVANIVTGYILGKDKEFAKQLEGKDSTCKVDEFFKERAYSKDSYAEFCIENSLQTTPARLAADIFSVVDPSKPRTARKLASSIVQNEYFKSVAESLRRNNLEVARGGIVVAASVANDWYVSPVYEIANPSEWTLELWKAKRLSGVLTGNISRDVRKSPQRNICPVIIAQKPTQ